MKLGCKGFRKSSIFSQTLMTHREVDKEGVIFIPFYHFYVVTNIQNFSFCFVVSGLVND